MSMKFIDAVPEHLRADEQGEEEYWLDNHYNNVVINIIITYLEKIL